MPKLRNRQGSARGELLFVAILCVLCIAYVEEPRGVSNGECPSNQGIEGSCSSAEEMRADAEGAGAQGTTSPSVPNEGSAEDTRDDAEGIGVQDLSSPNLLEGDTVAAASLHGTWQANFRRTNENRTLTNEERELVLRFVDSMHLSVTFGANSSYEASVTMMGQSQTETGSYEVLSIAGNTATVRITTSVDGSEAPKIRALIATFEDNARMILTEVIEAESVGVYFDRAP